jgi:hypothetical protein
MEEDMHGHSHGHSHSHSHNGVECTGDHGAVPSFPGEIDEVVCNGYTWKQDRDVITVIMPIGAVKGKDVNYKLTPSSLSMGIKGSALIIDGDLQNSVKPDDSLWEVESIKGTKCVVAKIQKGKAQSWHSLLKEVGA